MSNELVAAAGFAASVAAAYVAARFSFRASKHATDTTAELTEEANAVTGFHQLVEDLQTEMTRLRQANQDLRRDHDVLRQEHNQLGEHVKTLERQRTKDKSLIRHLVDYVRVLRDLLTQADQEIPPGPAGIDLEGGPVT